MFRAAESGAPPAGDGRRRLKLSLWLAAGVSLFWAAFHDTSVRAVWRALDVNPWWLAAALLSAVPTLAFAAWRWRILLGLPADARARKMLFAAIVASQSANILMPWKLGDAVRIGVVSREWEIPPVRVLGSVVVERLLDGLMLMVAALSLLGSGQLPLFARRGLGGLVVALSTCIVLAAVVNVASSASFWAPLSRALPPRLYHALRAQVEQVPVLLAHTMRRRTIGSGMAITCGVFAASALTPWLLMQAFGLSLPFVAAVVLIIVLQVGNVLVPVPGGIGVAQVLTAQTLGLWHVPEAEGLAYALMLFAVARAPKLIVLPFSVAMLSRSAKKETIR